MEIPAIENGGIDNRLPKKIIFVNEDTGFKNATSSLQFKNDDRFCRVTLRVGTDPRKIFANGNVLAVSPFFNEMLTKANEQIHFLDLDFEAVDSLINYFYTGIVEISEENVEKLLIAAERFELRQVQNKCIDFMTVTNRFPITNKILVYPRFVNRKQYLESYDFTTKETERLHEVRPPRVVAGLISYDDRLFYIGGTTELKCYYEDADSRISSPVVEVFIEGESMYAERYKLTEPRKEFGTCVCLNYLYVIGGCQGIEAINCVERLSLRNKKTKPKWEEVEYMKFARGAHDVAVLDNKIYAIGGVGQIVQRGGAVDLSSVVRYNPGRDIWETMPDMNEARGFARTAVIGTDIYVVGGNVWEYGFTDRRTLNTVEVFNSIRQTWTVCPPMHHCRCRGMVMVQDGLLYAIGGNSKLNPSIEVYDPRIEKWMELAWPPGLEKGADFTASASFDV